MKAILANYNYDPSWLLEYPHLEPIIYDRSDDGIERDLTKYGRTIKTKNIGDVDYDKLGYLIEHYDDLPDVFLWGKTNLFKYVDKETFETALLKSEFTPLLTSNHRIYSDKWGPVNRYEGPLYAERADSWFFHANLDTSGRFTNWQDWASTFSIPQKQFIPFPPGGNFILTSDRVHRYSKDYYQRMWDTLPYATHPVEAHCCERSYFLLWQ